MEEYDDEDFRLRLIRPRKDSVSDLVKILDKDLELQTRRGVPLTPMQQLLIALRFYAPGTVQRVISDSKKGFLEAIKNYFTSDYPPVL